MIQYWKCEGGFKQLPEWQADCWIQVTAPSQVELEDLVRRFEAPWDFIQDVEDTEERPRTENEGGWLDNDGEQIYSTVPLAILVHGEIFISICYYNNEMVNDFIRWSNRKMIEGRERYDLMLSLFLSSSVWYLKYLKQMNIKMKAAEEALEESMDNDRLQQMMLIEKFLVYFITSIRGNEVVLVRLKKHLRHLPYDEDLLDDVEVELQQAYATANIYSEVLERQRASYSSIISNNLNAIMKRLTTITIILMIPAAISGFFGMNVPNGWESYYYAFPIIGLATLVIVLICYFIFKKKDMF